MLDRKRTLENDLKVRQEQGRLFADQSQPRQSSTYYQHAVNDASIPLGRFSAISNATVVGSKEFVGYPAASAHQHDPCGPEPALGYAIDALDPQLMTTEGSGSGAVAPLVLSPDVEPAPPSTNFKRRV
jgi:hypothetical protein